MNNNNNIFRYMLNSYSRLLSYIQHKNIKDSTLTDTYQKLNRLEDNIEYYILSRHITHIKLLQQWEVLQARRIAIIETEV